MIVLTLSFFNSCNFGWPW